MSYSASMRALLLRCAARRQRCEGTLAALARREQGLQREQQALTDQHDGLRQLLLAQAPAGRLMNSGELFALQRKQAVLRRQLLDLSVQIDELTRQRQALAASRVEQQSCHGQWLRKEGKYRRRAKADARREHIRALAREETELEERIIWTP